MDKHTVRFNSLVKTAYNHKFKLVFFFLFCYLGKKGYDLYKTIKPFLAMSGGLMNGKNN